MSSVSSKSKILFLLIFLITSNIVYAKNNVSHNSRHSSLIIDRSDGSILHQENASKHRYPASLTKMMTVYLTFEALKAGKITLDQELIISNFAASKPKSNMNLVAGEKITLRDALFATIIKSANDTSVALAEAISGDEVSFAKKMTDKAHKLGMHHTLFKNASGLPNLAQKTTAHDMAKLAIALDRDFPEYYSYFSKNEFIFRGSKYYGHNRVTKNYPGATGLKTGFINASGFNLVTSAKRGDVKLIGVVFGGDTAQSRDKKMITLLDQYFSKYQNNNEDVLTQFASNNQYKKVLSYKKSINKTKKTVYKLVANTKVKNLKKKTIS